jgi:hypothetical protein
MSPRALQLSGLMWCTFGMRCLFGTPVLASLSPTRNRPVSLRRLLRPSRTVRWRLRAYGNGKESPLAELAKRSEKEARRWEHGMG